MNLNTTNVLFYTNIFVCLILNVRSQSNNYDYGYATNPMRYTRTVKLKQGNLQGVVVEPRINRDLHPVEQFLGIPYAASPTRELRFMPPGSAPSWFGTKIADSFGPVCPQKLPDVSTMTRERTQFFEKLVKHIDSNQSEDCLYLNIYTPVQGLEVPLPFYPVMVFLHGESYEWNSGNPYDGSVLAAYGRVIVVTLNFRLGVLGFLKTGLEESAASNFGLVDQVAALLWVQDNIAAFGGDPKSVTLFGHGTGAVCANLLMLSPMITKSQNQLLFRRVILMGGTALADWALSTTPREVTHQIAAALNCPSSGSELAECLRRRNLNDIVNVTAKSDFFKTRLGPVIDGRIIPNDPKHVMTKMGDLKRFEMMYGVAEVESAFFMESLGLNQILLENDGERELIKYIRTRCELKSDLCLKSTMQEYKAKSTADNPDKTKLTKDKLLDMLSDARTVAPVVQMGRLHSVVNPQSYFYVFGHTSSSQEYYRNRSIHGDELPYVFGIPLDGPKFHLADHYTPREKLLSEVMMTFFTNFAHSGNPNVPQKSDFLTVDPDWMNFNVEWPEYDIHDESYLYFALPPEVRYHYRKNEVLYWNEILPSLLTKKHNFKPSETAPSWLYPKPISKATAVSSFDKYDNFYKPPTHPTSVYGTIKYKPLDNQISGKTIEYGSVITAEPEKEINSGSVTNLLVIVGCLFLLVNIFIFVGLYYKCVKLKNKETKRQEEYQIPTEQELDKKPSKEASSLDGCNLMRMISKSSKSEDIYEAVKISDDGSNARFKLIRQTSSSTIDPHTKVRDWIAQEIVQRCSPRFLRRSKQQLANDLKEKQDSSKTIKNVVEQTTIDSESTLGQSPTRPVSPAEASKLPISVNLTSVNEMPIVRPAMKKAAKVSVAIDATPSGRGSSVMRQQPIEFTKSLDYQHLDPKPDQQLRRSFTMDDVVNLQNQVDQVGESFAVINLKQPQAQTRNGLKIQHQHSKSDPVQHFDKPIPSVHLVPKKLKTFGLESDVNVTCKDEALDTIKPLTPEQQLLTIKRRNFPKVLPDFPQPSKEALAKKRLSMPTQGYLHLPIRQESSFSPMGGSAGKMSMRLPPAVPPRTSSTLGRNIPEHRVCDTPAALAEEPPSPEEPEVTFNNLYIGPLIPTSTQTKKSGSTPDIYKQNIQQIYEHLKPKKSPEKSTEKQAPKAIVTTDVDNPVKRVEPKVVIKPIIAKKSNDLLSKAGARVIARNSNDEKLLVSKSSDYVKPVIQHKEESEIGENIKDDVINLESKARLGKVSQIPTLVRSPSNPSVKKESSSSESTPSEESDTGTIVTKV